MSTPNDPGQNPAENPERELDENGDPVNPDQGESPEPESYPAGVGKRHRQEKAEEEK